MRRIIMASAIALALGGCGRGAPDAEQGNAAAPAPAPQTALASPGSPASEVRTDAAFSGLPAGIPAYPRTDGRGAIQMGDPSDAAGVRIMAFQTPDPPAAVIAFYAEAGARAGYRAVHRAEAGPSTALGLARANGDALNVTATAGASGTTRVQIMTGNERRHR